MPQAVKPLIETLGQLEAVVASLEPWQYAEPAEPISDSSIGSHVRHCLDHVEALLSATVSGAVDYDARRRGTPDETSPRAAMARLRVLQSRLAALDPGVLEQRVTVRSLLSPDEAPVETHSSLGRELAYVTSHTTHHNAIIGFLVRAVGGSIPDRFGYAPSTLAYIAQALCAR